MQEIKNRYYENNELIDMGYTSLKIKALVQNGKLVKIKQGLYRNSLLFSDNQSFLDVYMAAPNSVICGLSALYYYQLTTHIPQKVYIAVLRGANLPKILYPPVKITTINQDMFNESIETVQENGYSFRIYGLEKTVCETFRNRMKIGIDITKEALKEYMRRQDRDISKLLKISEICKVRKSLESLLEVML
ncbi:MAG: hypothetical protein LBV16_08585 [Elusimicrobiota bacterium]|jgi:predicted transcriptional regulator of viral defense system|nr:hypothetical protein [Elusimicrobiota bacterium]